MAPVDLYNKVKLLYVRYDEPQKTLLTTFSATLISITFVVLYVFPFYLSSKTRPSATLNRDNPSVIRARVRIVYTTATLSILATLFFLCIPGERNLSSSLHQLGLFPINPVSIIKSLLLTLIIYLGPLYESVIVDRDLSPPSQIRHQLRASLASWLGYRNYIVGPVTEELLFRSAIVTIHMLADVSPTKIIFLTPLYFGIAHINHFYEFRLTHPHTPWMMALLRSLFHVTYTTIFGWYASFIFLRTGNIYAVILIHAFCNYQGLPRFWGTLKAEQEPSISSVAVGVSDDIDTAVRSEPGPPYDIGHTVAYYVLLFTGAFSFHKLLFPLTETPAALASFGWQRDQ